MIGVYRLNNPNSHCGVLLAMPRVADPLGAGEGDIRNGLRAVQACLHGAPSADVGAHGGCDSEDGAVVLGSRHLQTG